MKRQFLLTRLLLLFALIVGSGSAWGQSVLYSETFGTTGNKTDVSSYSGFSSDLITPTSSGWKISDTSTGTCNITGTSGSCNAYCGGTSDFVFNFGNKLSNYTNVKLSFNYYKGAGKNKANTLKLYISGDGGDTYGSDLLPSNTSATGWYSVTNITIPVAALSNLRIKFSSATNTNRIDDIKITGVTSLPSSAATFATETPEITFPETNTYSQVPTTADGYDGEITYSMTENTAGATINPETGLVTVTKGGSVTVKATAAAVAEKFLSSEDTYTLTVNDTRASAGLAWSAASANVNYGDDDNVFPTLTNPHGVSVTYSSSNTSAATIDESGVITLKDKTASTTISAIFAGNEDYKDQTVTYTLNVTEGPFVLQDGVFDFVKAASADPFEDYGSGMTVSDSYTTTPKTWTAGKVTMVTSRVSGSGYRWWSADGTLRFYDESNATFSVPNGYVITKIVTTGANFDSSNPSGLSGSTWTGASQSVKLTATAGHNIKTITVTYTTANQTITPAKAVTTYVTTQKLDFTEVDGLKAYIATSKGTNTVNMTAVDAPVPAGTALLLKKTSGTSFNVPVVASATAPTTNYLKAGPITFAANEDSRYILKDGEFYLAGAGDLAADKAYLDLTGVVAGARQLSIVFDDEETTGISNVDITKPEVKDNVYYNLNGQRVANPSKGLFIVNGKKVIIK